MYPTSNLQPGATGVEVRKLQNYLVSQNLMSPADITGPGTDVYGPKTQAAVAALQAKLGVDTAGASGYWGPKTITALSGGNTPPMFSPAGGIGSKSNGYTYTKTGWVKDSVAGTSGNVNSGNTGNTGFTQAEVDAAIAVNTAALQANAITAASIAHGNTAEAIANAFSTGDWSGVVNEMGQPFTLQEQQDALKKGQEDNQAYYDQLKQKETQDSESKLKQNQLDYQNYLATQKTNFEGDKSTLDQNAADKGVLFSGGRAQKERSLQNTYASDQAYKQASMANSIGNTARDFQYAYGNDAAGGLSQYYNLGGNQYNANTAQGGVTPGGLSSIYSTGNSNFAGTRLGERATSANTFAANYLKNKSNKLQLTGYNTKL